MSGLEQKNIFSATDVVELEDKLKERDINKAFPTLIRAEPQSHQKAINSSQDTIQTHGQRLDKRQIEQRIEEDRERHKRLRERIWAVTTVGDGEFDKLWEESSAVGDDDYILAEEEANEREKAFSYQYSDSF